MIKKRSGKYARSYLDASLVRKRRRRKRLMLRILSFIVLIGFGSLFIYTARLDAFQIKTIVVKGADQIAVTEVQDLAHEKISQNKNLFGFVPQTSTLFADDASVRDAIIEHFITADAVTVDTGIWGTMTITLDEKKPVAKWCPDIKATATMSNPSVRTANASINLSTATSSKSQAISTSATSTGRNTNTGTSTGATTTTKIAASRPTSLSQAVPIAIIPEAECLYIDKEGFVFTGRVGQPIDPDNALLPLMGLLGETATAGQAYLSGKEIGIFIIARQKLAAMNQRIEYIRCESKTFCEMHLARFGYLKFDPSQDLDTAFDRFFAALKSPPLSDGSFEYVDIRYGNKLFYKMIGKNEEE